MPTVYRGQDGTLSPVRCSVRLLQKHHNKFLLAIAASTADRDGLCNPSVGAACRDSLTGLPNRDWLLHRIEQDEKHSQYGSNHIAVLFIDVDRFKVVNDAFGHLAGDRVLQMVARH